MNISNTSGVSALTLPLDLIRSKIMPKLEIEDCGAMAIVCKQWNHAVAKPRQIGTVEGTKEGMSALDQKLLEESIFGKRKWEQIRGVVDVGEEPVLTEKQKMELVAKLKEPCQFFNEPDTIQPHRFQGKNNNRTWKICMVLLFPETINLETRTVNLSDRVFSFEKEGEHESVFDEIYGNKDAVYRNKPARKSYFALVTKDVVPKSRATAQAEKIELLTAKGWRMPETANEALTIVLILNVGPSQAKEDYFFSRKEEKELSTCTATAEISHDGYPLVVGAAGRQGTGVSIYTFDSCRVVGVAAVQEVL